MPQGSSGVKVYVPVPAIEVLIVDGLHEPVRPFSETVGNDGGTAPTHNGPI